MSALDSFSRFKESELVLSRDGRETFGLMTKFDFMNRENLTAEQIVKVVVDGTRAGRSDLIAEDLYSTTFHAWVLLMFNHVQDPFGWPKNGTVIEAPARSLVLAAL